LSNEPLLKLSPSGVSHGHAERGHQAADRGVDVEARAADARLARGLRPRAALLERASQAVREVRGHQRVLVGQRLGVVAEADDAGDRLVLGVDEAQRAEHLVDHERVAAVVDDVAHAVVVVRRRVDLADHHLRDLGLVDERHGDRVDDGRAQLIAVGRVVAALELRLAPQAHAVRALVVVQRVQQHVVDLDAHVGQRLADRHGLVVKESDQVERDDRQRRVALLEHQRPGPQAVALADQAEPRPAHAGRGAAVVEARQPARLELAVALALVGRVVAGISGAQAIAAAVEDRVVRRLELGVVVGVDPRLEAARHDRQHRGAGQQRRAVDGIAVALGIPGADDVGHGVGRRRTVGVGVPRAQSRRSTCRWRSSVACRSCRSWCSEVEVVVLVVDVSVAVTSGSVVSRRGRRRARHRSSAAVVVVVASSVRGRSWGSPRSTRTRSSRPSVPVLAALVWATESPQARGRRARDRKKGRDRTMGASYPRGAGSRGPFWGHWFVRSCLRGQVTAPTRARIVTTRGRW
jgi:hypothetical protein